MCLCVYSKKIGIKKGDEGMKNNQLVYVKPFQSEYIPSYLDMFSPRVQELLGVSSLYEERTYLEGQLHKASAQQTSLYGIFEQETDILIGSFEIKSPSYRSQLSMWLHEKYWGKGYFQQAFALVKELYFKEHPQETFFSAYVDAANPRSYNALLKAGCAFKGMHNGRYYIECD